MLISNFVTKTNEIFNFHRFLPKVNYLNQSLILLQIRINCLFYHQATFTKTIISVTSLKHRDTMDFICKMKDWWAESYTQREADRVIATDNNCIHRQACQVIAQYSKTTKC